MIPFDLKIKILGVFTMERKILYLFDLDGTITIQENEEFERAYTKLLFNYASVNHLPLDTFKVALETGVSSLSAERDGSTNNYNCFMRSFTDKMGSGNADEYSDFFEKFYASAYDSLRAVVSPRSEMIETIADLVREEHKIVLATNPMLPEIAIKKKLEWLGLTSDTFILKTVMENSYYVKPHKKYFENILKETVFSSENTLMIGNDERMDGASVKAGIAFINVKHISSFQI